MTGTEWKQLAGYGALVLAVGYFDTRAAYWLLGLLGIVAIVKHSDAITGLFGAATSAAGGSNASR